MAPMLPIEGIDKKAECTDVPMPEPKGDPEMTPVYIRRLLPLFLNKYRSTLLQSARRSSVNLIQKAVHYATPDLLSSLADKDIIALVEVCASLLVNEVRIRSCSRIGFLFHFLFYFSVNKVKVVAEVTSIKLPRERLLSPLPTCCQTHLSASFAANRESEIKTSF
jgi:hypothetical protein